ncbi:hypothetical protein CPC08DRAFT_233285 [Agrocybe pediades]|nr:hypothetical protein CPC08DRAFT_233285 [Agrocybe pediades]
MSDNNCRIGRRTHVADLSPKHAEAVLSDASLVLETTHSLNRHSGDGTFGPSFCCGVLIPLGTNKASIWQTSFYITAHLRTTFLHVHPLSVTTITRIVGDDEGSNIRHFPARFGIEHPGVLRLTSERTESRNCKCGYPLLGYPRRVVFLLEVVKQKVKSTANEFVAERITKKRDSDFFAENNPSSTYSSVDGLYNFTCSFILFSAFYAVSCATLSTAFLRPVPPSTFQSYPIISRFVDFI